MGIHNHIFGYVAWPSLQRMAKVNGAVLLLVQQPGSYLERLSVLTLVGVEPIQRSQLVTRCQTS